MFNADPAREPWHAWVNPLAQRRLARGEASPAGPRQDTLFAAVVLFDISGFTALAEDLARSGPIGAERLKERLDACFGTITALVHEHGGLVLTYPGDGVLALWIADDDRLSAAAASAAACCLAAVARMSGTTQGESPLQLRAGLAAGSVDAFSVGGVGGHWESPLAGRAVQEAGTAVAAARAGEVTVAATAWTLLDGVAEGVPAGDGMHRVVRLLTDRGRKPIPDTSTPRAVTELEADALRPYIPDAVLAHLDAGQADWLAAFRPATVMFIGLASDRQGGAWALEALHGVICCVQSVVRHYGGSLNQALVDDTGTVIVVGWGLAMHVHEDDASRAVEAALDMHAALDELGCRAAIGLATGRIFTGIRGSRVRKEYAMIGDVVNLAARLMQGGAGIICDDRTRASARTRVMFEKLPSVRLKGKSEPISVYRPLRKRDSLRGDGIVGRDDELRTLVAHLRSLERQGSPEVVVIEGEPGIGKSRLTAALLHHAQASGVRSISARGNSVERSSSYHAWRPLFSRLLHLDGYSAAEARERITSLLRSSHEGPADAGHDDELIAHAPLLNSVLPLGFADTEAASRMTPQGGAEVLRDLLVRLFAALTRGNPTLLVMEDAHWFDSASWALADDLAGGGRSLLVVATMRPMLAHEMTAECRRFFDRSGLSRLALDTLGPLDAAALASHCLGADMLPPAVGDLIWRRASGHPFFTEQLALALRDSGVIRIDEGECSLVADSSTLDALTLPETVQGVVTSRIDRLTPSQQTALKIASVIGPVFSCQAVQALFPGGVSAAALEPDLDAMVTQRLLVPDPGRSAADA